MLLEIFISTLSAPLIRYWLLENKMLTLTEAENQAQCVDRDILNSEAYSTDTQTNYLAASI